MDLKITQHRYAGTRQHVKNGNACMSSIHFEQLLPILAWCKAGQSSQSSNPGARGGSRNGRLSFEVLKQVLSHRLSLDLIKDTPESLWEF